MTANLHPIRLSIFALCLNIPFMLIGCQKTEQNPQTEQKESVDPSVELKTQIEAQPIKSFESTPNDAHDVALLNQYEQSFEQLSDELDAELQQLKADGNLNADMEFQRKRDLIQSSLNMLKELDLKTEQGRYIQGLFYQYWENQIEVYQELEQSPEDELRNPKDAIRNMSDYYTAKAQLQHWSQNTSVTKEQ
ncbi:hypothetical protein [Acinetobacter sp. DSM 11652]|uniref:hypothetical protein n=1 Tax=Acinetobacter sp. DSM 11652 TaxID=346222 RepID=UPI0008C51997|nr:hypothetical protein [Acinetobacter sp. DSM 11652]SEL66281.1 hypothetical protein SAMN05216500_104111 [Acinetobacter sp. DSM 11652]